MIPIHLRNISVLGSTPELYNHLYLLENFD